VSEASQNTGPSPEEIAAAAKAAEAAAREREMLAAFRRRTRRSFLTGGVAAAAGFAAWQWLRSRRPDESLPWPLRRSLEINEQWARDYFSPSRLAPVFPASMAVEPRVNGTEGLSQDFDLAAWKLRVEGLADADEPAFLALDDIRRLPRVETVNELKCVEGWSAIVRWAGARLSDFVEQYAPAEGTGYAGMATPDGEFYVGLDMDSLMQPQSLLCYEMNGQPLTLAHGAPLRLVIPVKYGYKNIKRIGIIRFSATRPADYWAEQGYDWYAGM
jgi:DMSO/TMAO reductase YedYZ molybdopterin-dependent catalytic subunit